MTPRCNVVINRVPKNQELAEKAKDAVNVGWQFGTHMVDVESRTSTWLGSRLDRKISIELKEIHSTPRVVSSRSTAKRLEAKTKFSHKSIREKN